GAAFIDLQRTLRELRERGVLLAISSKNDHDDALAAIDGHPEMLLRSDDFHATRIGWMDKATGLRDIAAELNIGLDALAFLDDNPAERLLIATELPEVAVLSVTTDPCSMAAAVRGCPLFERLELTPEDRQRSDYYVRERKRSQSQAGATSLEGYLRSLGTEVQVAPAEQWELARVAQLTQKTNQFNMTTRRYSEQQIIELAEHPAWSVYALSASDRFGDHGLVATALVEQLPDRWRIDTLLMSCRVIGRDVEAALLQSISKAARAAEVTELVGEFVPTAKNLPARGFYGRHGFSERISSSDVETWVLDVGSTTIDLPEWLTLVRDSPLSEGAT
ncbi:MAG: HAD-IIIC family phosphatase, partial [Ilumatobacter sp.]